MEKYGEKIWEREGKYISVLKGRQSLSDEKRKGRPLRAEYNHKSLIHTIC